MADMRPDLQKYLDGEVIPRYGQFDKAHREDHARAVISRALDMAAQYPEIDIEMLYTAAACHDLGLAIDRKTHHLESGRIIREDARLREWFTPEQIEVIAEAAEDHRASAKTPPRSLYGCLVAEADRMIVPETIIRRTVQFGLDNYGELDHEHQWLRFREHMDNKYSINGYIKLWISGSPNEQKLTELRNIIAQPARLREVFERIYEEETKSE